MAKRTKIIEKSFYCDMYEVEISYLFGSDIEDLKRFMKARHGADAKFYSWDDEFKLYEETNITDGYSFHIFTPLGNADKFYVWKAYTTSGLMGHETFHLTGDIMFTIGAKYSKDSEECYAYLDGWISKKICELLNVKIKMPKQ